MSINTITLGGNLGVKPELKETSAGKPMTSLFVIIDDSYLNRETNEKIESTVALSVYVYGKQAANCVKYLDKGRFVYVEGKISQYKKTNEQGEEKTHTNFVARNVQFGNKGATNTDTSPKSEDRPF